MDINSTITIKDDKVAEYKRAFLRVYPVPSTPEISENEWLLQKAREVMKIAIITVYNRGRNLLARDMQPTAEEIIGA